MAPIYYTKPWVDVNLYLRFPAVLYHVPGKENVCIKVKVIRLWKVHTFLNPSKFSSVEMVLMDEKSFFVDLFAVISGAKIHDTIRKQLFYMFDSKVDEGKLYEMSYFSVFPPSGNYRTTLHPYKLVFQVKTSVLPGESSGFTQYGINVTSLAEICAYHYKNTLI
ncbi:hypothetical protein TSUD_279690 [Trifolium subterraneum]|uniref:Replication protein A 70 kDa DNA-binding subunit B/D first OB fold domain-containing protein n=1 Tax=Trifolium subterraneum TaxID=3900 RepID=A0A2Z6ML64_TRISU|nr:hypothetical protein TSUD_279690 [Trifolium subterraneum]